MKWKFWERKPKTGQDLIRVGSTGEMTITRGKIKSGHNKVEGKFYIQITDNRNLESFRIYMDEEFYKNFTYHLSMVTDFETHPEKYHWVPATSSNKADSNQSTPHSHKENNQDNPQTPHI